MKKKYYDYIITILGFVLLIGGFIVLRLFKNVTDAYVALPYVIIGLACGLLGHGIGAICNRRAIKNNPEIEKNMQIAINDERNIAINRRAKSKAFDIMVFVFGAVNAAFGIMGVDMIVIIILVVAYLFVCGSSIYYQQKYNKEM